LDYRVLGTEGGIGHAKQKGKRGDNSFHVSVSEKADCWFEVVSRGDSVCDSLQHRLMVALTLVKLVLCLRFEHFAASTHPCAGPNVFSAAVTESKIHH
jgi:hypothetical protein